MTDKKDEISKGGAGDAKRPHAVIDLKASEVVINSGNKAGGDPKPQADATGQGPKASSVPPGKPADAKREDGKPSAVAGLKPDASAATPAKSSGGFGSQVAAAMLGGAVALAGAQFVVPLLAPGEGAPNSQEVSGRLSALERAAQARPANGDAVQKLVSVEARIAKLEDMARALADGQAKVAEEARQLDEKLAAAGASGDAAARLAKVEEQFSALTAAATNDPRNAGRLPQLALLTSKIGDLETQLTTRTATLRTELSQEMERRFAQSGEQVESARSRLAARTQTVEQTLKSVADETTALRGSVDGLKSELDARFLQAAKPSDVQAALAPLSTKVGSLEQNIQGVVKSEQARNATAGNILLSLELGNLKRALDRGGKFTAELGAVKSLAGGKLDLGTLEAQAATGVPSAAALAGELRSLAHAMLDAEQEQPNASVADRMMSGFKSIVRVRRTTAGPDEPGTEATIARMETALKDGRLGDVLEEAKKLSQAAAQPAQAWLKRIETRHAVDKALAALEASLKTSIAGGALPKKGAD